VWRLIGSGWGGGGGFRSREQTRQEVSGRFIELLECDEKAARNLDPRELLRRPALRNTLALLYFVGPSPEWSFLADDLAAHLATGPPHLFLPFSLAPANGRTFKLCRTAARLELPSEFLKAYANYRAASLFF
jgi:hypothetical protein